MVWATDLALAGAGLEPRGLPYKGAATFCSHCGKPIAAGDLFEPVRLREMFSDTRDLAAGTRVVCGNCVVLRTKRAMNRMSFVVITRNAMYPIAKRENKAWFLLTPPVPPFVAVHSSATMQHLVWRTPPTLSRELILLRRGGDLLRIRRQSLLRGLDVCRGFPPKALADREANQANGKSRSHGELPAHPFWRLDSALREDTHGRLSGAACRLLGQDDIEALMDLTPGELWALSFLATHNPPTPVEPEPVTIDFLESEEA